MSNGTEKANITGEPNISVFGEANPEVKFPRYCGYSSAGIVEEIHYPTECGEVFDRLVNDKNFPNVV